MISGNLTNEDLGAGRTKAEGPTTAAGAGAVVAKSPVLPTSRHWPPSTESRIVRVSRVFGGKDRHSKVRTVKGLRDRRVRLSVPTAIQLYDLQDRLGLSQPSKVVDWLLDAAQHEIDKLPPLQFPPQAAQDLVAHLPPPSMVAPFAADRAEADGDKRHCHAGVKGLMGLNNSIRLVNATMPLAHGLYYTPGESWTGTNADDAAAHDHQTVAHGHSPFSSLLSLAAPGPQLVFYSSEGGGFTMKEEATGYQFPVQNSLDHSQGQLSLSSARSFLRPGNQV
jgi:hypothetical protein